MKKNGKRIVGEAKQPKIYRQNMDLDAYLESIFCNLDHPAHAIQCSESFVFQSVFFETESKKLIIEKIDVKNKKRKHRS
jgi:hypothetical protein